MFERREAWKSGEKALSKAQVEKLLENVTDMVDYALLLLAIDCGFRREDVVTLRTNAINLKNSTVIFYEKKKNRNRAIDFGSRTKQALEMYLKIHKGRWLFPARQKRSKTGHLSDRSAYNILNKYLRQAGLEERPFHALRATTYKLCKAAGWSTLAAAKRLGDSVRVAEEHYGTPSDEEMKELTKEKPIL